MVRSAHSIGHGGRLPVTAQWNSGTRYSGSYRVRAELIDGKGLAFAEAVAGFGIAADPAPTLGAKVTADQASYLPTDTVRIAGRIVNRTQNLVLEGLSAVTTVKNPDGSPRWTQTQSLPQLMPTASKELAYSLPLDMAAAGGYAVSLSVLNAQGKEMANSAASFQVQSSAVTGSGLKGSLVASPRKVYIGDPVNLEFGASNLGNADLKALPLSVVVVDPASQTEISRWSHVTDLARQGRYPGRESWATQGLRPGIYVAVLGAAIGGKTLALAQDTIELADPLHLDRHRQWRYPAFGLAVLPRTGVGRRRTRAFGGSG